MAVQNDDLAGFDIDQFGAFELMQVTGHSLPGSSDSLRQLFTRESDKERFFGRRFGGLRFQHIQNKFHKTLFGVLEGDFLDKRAEAAELVRKQTVQSKAHLGIGLDHPHILVAGKKPDLGRHHGFCGRIAKPFLGPRIARASVSRPEHFQNLLPPRRSHPVKFNPSGLDNKNSFAGRTFR